MTPTLSDDLNLSDASQRLMRMWPLILAAGLMGGLLGLASGTLVAPRYLATASLGIGADPNLAEPLNGNVQVEANLRIQDLLLSDATLEAARGQLSPELAGNDLEAFRAVIRLEKYDTRWDLEAMADSPRSAADRANAWAQAAESEFQAASAHALKAGQFQALLFSVACQPEVLIDGGTGDLWACDEMDLGLDPAQVSADLLEEARLSQGILPALSLTELESASPPEEPLREAVPVLAFAGTVAGLMLGLVLVGTGMWPRTRSAT